MIGPGRSSCVAAACLLAAAVAGPVSVVRAAEDPPRPPSLKTVPVPEPANLGDFVRDRAAAVVLGKALFWDMQAGSDGVVACATCHFRAGADPRSRNALNPGSRRVAAGGAADPDTTFMAPFGPNRALSPSDFPISPQSNDVVSSAGIARFVLDGLARTGERLFAIPDMDGFRVGAANVRRVEPRNTPTVINAVFNHRNFWDGRAANAFNGVNELGDADPGAVVFRAAPDGTVGGVRVRLEDSSLASQAVVPLLSDVEMAAAGRTMAHVAAQLAHGRSDAGARLALRRPLAGQLVHPDDGVLGPWSRWPAPGLRVPQYALLIRQAFHEAWWRGELLERNFSLFFGLAIQLYEATLVADDSPWDRFMDGDGGAVGADVLRGADLFRSQTRGRCINCHEGAELTGASVRRVRESPTRIREGQALDRGFNNLGVRPTTEDLGVGGTDALGAPLSTVRQLDPPPAEPLAVDGAMKVPGLRNVALTAPYFHNGGLLTLGDVLAFYSRGGDVRPQRTLDGVEIAPLAILDNTPEELADLEAFLRALTDERVAHGRAPFDHPQLFVSDGHSGDQDAVADDGAGTARDRLLEIPAVGRAGGPPLPGFLDQE